jgi:hypothetical protein
MKLDHIIYIMPNLEVGMDEFEEKFGIRPCFGGKHNGIGTHNALLSLGDDSYFEILTPDPAEKLNLDISLEQFQKPHLIAWAVQSDNIEKDVLSLAGSGFDYSAIVPMSRKKENGSELKWKLTSGAPHITKHDSVQITPFLIEWLTTPHPATSTPRGCSLVSLRAEHPDPDKIRPLLELMEIPIELKKGDSPRLIATIKTPKGIIELS